MGFWTKTAEPLRQNRWYATFEGGSGSLINKTFTYALKEFQKPSYEISTSEHRLLTQTFKYPGLLKWNPIEVKYVSAVEGNGTLEKTLHERILNSGYKNPGTGIHQQISKKEASFTKVVISELKPDGKNAQTWTLFNCFINKINFGSLSYEQEGFVEVSLTLQYDYATVT